MTAPAFVPVAKAQAKRVVRLAPAAVAYTEVDYNGHTIVHLVGGETLTVLETQEQLEAMFAGEPVVPARAAKRKAA